ncbi:MAG: CXXX repeat peptide maturase [Myxococcota bacterium]|nr:CXXX repeat peptide maturase [Myxococcota bacterium]
MKSLLMLLSDKAPSFCYYKTKNNDSEKKQSMERRVFLGALEDARKKNLALHLLGDADDHIANSIDDTFTREHTCIRYFPLTDVWEKGKFAFSGIPIIDEEALDCFGHKQVPRLCETLKTVSPGGAVPERRLSVLQAEKFPIVILRCSRQTIHRLFDIWKEISRHVYRVVLIWTDIPSWEERDLDVYQQALNRLSKDIFGRYKNGERIELNIITDRLGLRGPVHCNAGQDHLTVGPDGKLYICPGFYFSGAQSVGSLETGPEIPNLSLYSLDRSPVCMICDAYHCRRCIFLNSQTTLEVNTPSWQQCRISHIEREAAASLGRKFIKTKVFKKAVPMPDIDYLDPMEVFESYAWRRFAWRAIARKSFQDPQLRRRPRARPESNSPQGIPTENKGKIKMAHSKQITSYPREDNTSRKDIVGEVTPEERDQVKKLYIRKTGLVEVVSTLSRLDDPAVLNGPLYERVIRDVGETQIAFQTWWDNIAQKYNWKKDSNKQWRIEFETCRIYLE